MKQATLAARVEMRQVIGTLCGLLKAAGLEAVPPPETFRRAKFGGGLDVVQSLFCPVHAFQTLRFETLTSQVALKFASVCSHVVCLQQGQLLQLLMEMLLRSGTVSSGDHMEGGQ